MNASTIASPGDNRGQTDNAEAGSTEPPEPPEPTNRGTEAAAALTLHNESDTQIDDDWLGARILASLPHLPRAVQRIDIAILDDAAMASMHRDFHNIDATTDVLTFDASEGSDAPLEVDIAVCADVARRQASSRGHTVEREMLLYTIHGLLHCMGYDDHDETSYATMHEHEDRILTAIGVGRTFTTGDEAWTSRSDQRVTHAPPSHKDASG